MRTESFMLEVGANGSVLLRRQQTRRRWWQRPRNEWVPVAAFSLTMEHFTLDRTINAPDRVAITFSDGTTIHTSGFAAGENQPETGGTRHETAARNGSPRPGDSPAASPTVTTDFKK